MILMISDNMSQCQFITDFQRQLQNDFPELEYYLAHHEDMNLQSNQNVTNSSVSLSISLKW